MKLTNAIAFVRPLQLIFDVLLPVKKGHAPMAKTRSLFQSLAFLLSTIVLGSLLALAAAARLRFGYPFKSLFQPTCIYIPDEEVVPTLGVFLLALALMVASSAVLLRRSAMLRRLLLGVAVGALAFEIGLLVHGTI